MEVKLDKRYPIAASVDQAWTVLSDIRAVAACMPGAQITEQLDETHFKGSVKSKVGPAVMSFGGDIELQGLDAATHALRMLGKGADKAGSSASMQLTAHLEPGDSAGACTLAGVATITVSGKLAQFGSRLLVPVSDAMLAQFADNFRAAAVAVPVVAAPVGPPAVDNGALTAPIAPTASDPAVPAAPGALHTAAAAQDASAAPSPAPGPAPGTSTRPAPAATPTPTAAPAPAATAAPAAAPGSGHAAPPVPPLRQVDPAPAQRPAQPVKELNALALLWTVFKGWVGGLFGRK